MAAGSSCLDSKFRPGFAQNLGWRGNKPAADGWLRPEHELFLRDNLATSFRPGKIVSKVRPLSRRAAWRCRIIARANPRERIPLPKDAYAWHLLLIAEDGLE